MFTLSMEYIPQVLVIDIARRVGHHGFRELGPLLSASPEINKFTLDPAVLHEVDIDEFIFVSRLANEGSMYRPFLLRCLAAGNETAQYVEGLRLAAQRGPSSTSIDLLSSSAGRNVYARFALGTFLICSGSYKIGLEVISSFLKLVSSVEEAVGIAEIVVTAIREMGTPNVGLYEPTMRFEGVPHCYLNNFSVLHLCPKCFAFKYATQFIDLC